MSLNNEEYDDLINETLNKVMPIIATAYLPHAKDNEDGENVGNFVLHVLMGLLGNFMLKLAQCTQTVDGKKITAIELFEEFVTNIRPSIELHSKNLDAVKDTH